MKKYIVGFLVCVVLVCSFGASVDRRNQEPYTKKVFRIEATQITQVSGDANDVSTTVNVNGIIRQITVGINNNDGDATATVAIIDDNGSVLFTTASVAESTSAAPVAQHYMPVSASDANALPLAIPVTGTITLNVDLSGDPGASGMEVDVVLYGD